MATSKSVELRLECTATASIFSGRRDPQWRVPVETARLLKELWERLELFESAPSPAPPLGYRGSVLDCGNEGRWRLYGEVVEAAKSYKRDPEHRFERLLLGSAPKGLIHLKSFVRFLSEVHMEFNRPQYVGEPWVHILPV